MIVTTPNTPLYDALVTYTNRDPARFHMPGHKGKVLTPALNNAADLDVTELTRTGDLYAGDDVIARAEALWAQACDMAHCQFLTGGSTQGLHAALLLRARRHRGILVDRCSHRSVYNALGLFDLEPTYLFRAQDRPVDPQAVAKALDRAGGSIKTVCITSPTYYGVLSDLKAIGQVCHEREACLVVDAAHGCHLPFLMDNAFLGADLVVTSAHKTLPVYGQGALLFSAGKKPFETQHTADDLRWAASVCGTSSPSYPVMASLDWGRAWMEEVGCEAFAVTRKFIAACEMTFNVLDPDDVWMDPARLTLIPAEGYTGYEAKERLESMGVFCEMADQDHVVFILTGADSPADYRRLWQALHRAECFDGHRKAPPMVLPPAPEVVLSPATALRTWGARRSLAQSEGWICLEQVAPYPPGVPVIAPGELVTKKCLAYLGEVGYNVNRKISVCM